MVGGGNRGPEFGSECSSKSSSEFGSKCSLEFRLECRMRFRRSECRMRFRMKFRSVRCSDTKLLWIQLLRWLMFGWAYLRASTREFDTVDPMDQCNWPAGSKTSESVEICETVTDSEGIWWALIDSTGLQLTPMDSEGLWSSEWTNWKPNVLELGRSETWMRTQWEPGESSMRTRWELGWIFDEVGSMESVRSRSQFEHWRERPLWIVQKIIIPKIIVVIVITVIIIQRQNLAHTLSSGS